MNVILRPVLAGEASDQEVVERGTGMRAAASPTSDDIVAFRDQIGDAPEIEIRERLAKIGHEGLDIVAAVPRFMQRILQQHVGCCEFVHDVQIAGLAPEIREPAADDGLVVFFAQTFLVLLFVAICHEEASSFRW